MSESTPSTKVLTAAGGGPILAALIAETLLVNFQIPLTELQSWGLTALCVFICGYWVRELRPSLLGEK